MTTAKKSASKTSGSSSAANKTSAKKTAAKKTPAKKAPAKKAPARKSAAEGNHCWPGFKPTPGKKAGEKGSCEPEAGARSKSTKKATQKTAAASKLEKAGKPNPKK